MAVPLRNIVGTRRTYDVGLDGRERSVRSLEVSGWKNGFWGKLLLSKEQSSSEGCVQKSHSNFSIHASICIPKHLRRREKSTVPNMTEVKSADQLVHSLLNAGDKLVVVSFYGPGCGGCRALHPKICQIAESNPSTIFLQVNYDEHKAMCSSLHIHVLEVHKGASAASAALMQQSKSSKTHWRSMDQRDAVKDLRKGWKNQSC